MRLYDYLNASVDSVCNNLGETDLGAWVKVCFRLLDVDDVGRPGGDQRDEEREDLWDAETNIRDVDAIPRSPVEAFTSPSDT